MAKLQETAESFTRKIEGERRKIEELDASIKELNAAVLEQRKKLGGSNVVRENNLKIQKQIKVLENRSVSVDFFIVLHVVLTANADMIEMKR
jgi:hypothetical protein